MAKMFVRYLVVAILSVSSRTGYGWTCHVSTECQIDVQMIQTMAVPGAMRANASRAEALVGVNIARKPGGSALIVARLSEATGMQAAMETQAVSTIKNSGLLAQPFVLANPSTAKIVSVSGTSVVYVYLPIWSLSALPIGQGLEELLLADFRSLAGWTNGYPLSVTIGADESSATSNSALGGGGAAVGDPHLQNIHGERFDLMQPGEHVLVHIPRREGIEKTLLHVQGAAQTLGGLCTDTYFTRINITGKWASALRPGGFMFRADDPDIGAESKWINLHGSSQGVQIKVVHGHTQQGTRYLNFYVKNLGRTGLPVGGLLGEDDHEEASIPVRACEQRLALLAASAVTS
mmetsp:Transcript_30943/g.70063  ORF Transcript_30943/g.70063 Transcript_30943/m.70063 type:complete len:348 (-) Transcript_30943:218-1261(-)